MLRCPFQSGRLRPQHALLLLALFSLVLLALIPRLVINNSPLVYLPPGLPAMQVEQQLRAHFSSDELLIAAFAGKDLFQDQFLASLDALVAELLRHELVDQVLAPSTAEQLAGQDHSITIESLLGPEAWRALSLSARKERLLAHRFARGLLVSDNGEVIAIAVRPVELQLSEQRRQLLGDFLDLIDKTSLSSHLRAVTGQVALDAAQMDLIIRTSLIFAPASLVIGMLMLVFPVRAFGAAAAAGILVQYLMVFWLLPGFFMGRPMADWSTSSHLLVAVDRLTRWLRGLRLRHPLKVLGLFVLLMAISLPWLGRIQSESDFERFFRAEHPLVQSTSFFFDNLTGPATISILAE